MKLENESSRDLPRLGVTSLSTKQIKNSERMMKTLIMTEKKVVNLREVKVLAKDTGNTNKNEKIAPQNICPVLECERILGN